MKEQINVMRVESTAHWDSTTNTWKVRTAYADSNFPEGIVSDHIVSAEDIHVLPLAIEATLGLEPSLVDDEWLEEDD